MRRWGQCLLVSALAALLAACSAPQEESFEPPRVVEESGYVETGDFDAVQQHNQLRLLVLRRPGGVDHLPRAGSPVHGQIREAARFAHSIGLEPVVVLVDGFEQLITALVEGRGDVAIANLAATPERRERIAFTVALDRSRQVLVARADDSDFETGPARRPQRHGGLRLALLGNRPAIAGSTSRTARREPAGPDAGEAARPARRGTHRSDPARQQHAGDGARVP
ncbi:MAG: transporter substrate-binding domain-containing protein [Halofilum sp. (in: g-proteobacteria)]|nr:transporter substrate-binding domain-containing protein [Halofilum sp. (in: g-proteobacteria)]